MPRLLGFLDFLRSVRQHGTVKSPASVTTPEEYLAWVPEPRRADLAALHQLIQEAVPGLKPRIIAGMIGYGVVPYRSKSGREGEWFTIGLANQKQNMTLYFCAAQEGKYLAETWQDRLGKVSVGKSCVGFNKLSDLNLETVAALAKRTVELGLFTGT